MDPARVRHSGNQSMDTNMGQVVERWYTSPPTTHLTAGNGILIPREYGRQNPQNRLHVVLLRFACCQLIALLYSYESGDSIHCRN